jgi:hypothetical protein
LCSIVGMARRSPANALAVTEDALCVGCQQIVGRRLVRLLDDQLAHLAQARAHGNRVLRLDHVVVAHLLAFFNPTIRSLRTIEGAFAQPRVRRAFGTPRIARSTLADAQRLFDPQLLQPLLADLRSRLRTLPRDPRLDALTRQILAVDATFFEVAARIAWAFAHNASARGTVQLCLHFDVLQGAPVGFTLVDGLTNEQAELPAQLQSGCLYLLDRGYQTYEHLSRMVAKGSDFVVRLRKSANFTPVEVRPLSAADRLAGVQRDWLVRATDRHYRFPTSVRLVELSVPGAAEAVRLFTNRLDIPAELIAVLYRHRWQIELFFRWLKCVASFAHFTSESPDGMALQMYIALIATLLIAVETGSRPSKYDLSLMSLAVSGLITLEEARAGAAARRAECTRAAVWQKAYNARRKNAQR